VTPRVGDHLRPDDADHRPGVYRVVGYGDRAALLRVADADGCRVHAGEVVRVDRDAFDGFVPADPPPDDGSARATVAYWSARAFAAELAARPLASLAGFALVVAGGVTPSPAGGAAALGGGLLLAAVGSGRLRS
jgi:hypothetical protein